MKTIWKFPLAATDSQKVSMPFGARILTVQTQNNTPCIWAEVDDKELRQNRFFEVFATGEEIPTDERCERQYIGTFQLHGGSLVFHVYERI